MKKTQMQNIAPAFAEHPGKLLLEELQERGFSQEDFANVIGKPVNKLNEIIKGKANITVEWALLIASALETSPDIRIGLQQDYELFLAKNKSNINKLQAIELYSRITQKFPIKELIKRGFINKWKKISELEASIKTFFNLLNIDDEVFTPCVNYRKSILGDNENNLKVWLRIGEMEAQKQIQKKKIKKYVGKEVFGESLKSIVNLNTKNDQDTFEEIEKILNDNGVIIMPLYHFEKTRVDGAVFWLKDNPVILMSFRYKRLDNFWFTLMHEIGHIILSGKTEEAMIDDTTLLNQSDNEEIKANEFSKEVLITKNNRISFINGPLNIIRFKNFCEQNNVNKSIVAGRLKYEGIIGYNQLSHITNVRIVLPKNIK